MALGGKEARCNDSRLPALELGISSDRVSLDVEVRRVANFLVGSPTIASRGVSETILEGRGSLIE